MTWSGVCTMGNQGLVVSSMESSMNDSPGCWFVMSAACGCGAVKWRYGVAMCFGWKGRWGGLDRRVEMEKGGWIFENLRELYVLCWR